MTVLRHAIVRLPGPDLARGLTTARLGAPDHGRMLAQHAAYVDALAALGLEVEELAPLAGHPDAHFVEDAAIVTEQVAVITRPGAPERRGEVESIEAALAARREIRRIEAPGRLDGGDVLQVADRVFIGLSGRTDEAGATQLEAILADLGLSATRLAVGAGLHLKSSLNDLGGGRLIVTEELAQLPALEGFERIVVPRGEEYACNALFVHGTVLLAAGFPRTRALVEGLGLPVVELDLSEARKMDGGLTCLSLRF